MYVSCSLLIFKENSNLSNSYQPSVSNQCIQKIYQRRLVDHVDYFSTSPFFDDSTLYKPLNLLLPKCSDGKSDGVCGIHEHQLICSTRFQAKPDTTISFHNNSLFCTGCSVSCYLRHFDSFLKGKQKLRIKLMRQ